MRRLIFILLCFILIGCSKYPIDNHRSSEEPLYIAQELMYLFPNHKLDFPIYFDGLTDFGESTLAIARVAGSKCISIRVKKSKWDASSDLRKRSLMLHELGHCLLGLDHTEVSGELMAPIIVDSILCVYDYGEEECLNRAKRLGGLNE